MTQDELNRAEWENPDNWTADSKYFAYYLSTRDSRTWVPKRVPWMGVTLNLGRPAGVAWLTSFLVGIPAAIAIFCCR